MKEDINKRRNIMKKKKFMFIVLCGVIALVFVGCGSKSKVGNEKSKGTKVEIDYSMYDFAEVRWARDTECDTETICFYRNGDFSYSCACGNSVNDADVVESYSYDNETKVFTLNCYEDIEGMITEIKLISCDGEKLELDFCGDIRVFCAEEDVE